MNITVIVMHINGLKMQIYYAQIVYSDKLTARTK